ncbi:cytochrome P450 [Trametes meyenii]|nr:cytochrome P450 [Trametes meyenii]
MVTAQANPALYAQNNGAILREQQHCLCYCRRCPPKNPLRSSHIATTMDSPFIFTITVTSIPLFLWVFLRRASHLPTFPGPKPLPLLGTILPPERVWLTLTELGKQYGPVYSLRFFRTPVLVVNSAIVARDLFELRSSKYANRPLPKIAEMAGFNRGVALEHDPVRLRLGRKVMHSVIQTREIEEYRDRIQHYIAIYLKSMLQSPSEFVQHARILLAGVTLEMSHGYEIEGPEDPFLGEAKILVKNFSLASRAGGWLVNWLPFLSQVPEWLPGMGFKRSAREWREHYDSVARKAFNYVKDEMARGMARPSMVYKSLVESSAEQIPEDIVMYSSAQVYTGGADTTASTISAFILMMIRHPEVQGKAQAEIDSVVGPDRLPTYADRERLPYTNAVLSEVLRTLPPISATLREPEEDDIYDGRLIAKGTVIIENFWGMLHDPTAYPDPDSFRPERWLGVDSEDVRHPLNIAFGFGRRICPGRLLAEELAFTAIALLLSLFHVTCAHDAQGKGKPIIPVVAQTDGSIIFPLPFTCNIRPRGERTHELIEDFAQAHG